MDISHGKDLDKIAICSHADCRAVTHISCLAEFFLASAQDLLPTTGCCPSCARQTRWAEVIKGARLRHNISTKGESGSLIEDEFADLEHDGLSSDPTDTMTDSGISSTSEKSGIRSPRKATK